MIDNDIEICREIEKEYNRVTNKKICVSVDKSKTKKKLFVARKFLSDANFFWIKNETEAIFYMNYLKRCFTYSDENKNIKEESLEVPNF